MSDNKNSENLIDKDQSLRSNIAVSSDEPSSVTGTITLSKVQSHSATSDRQSKFERAQKCLENAALVSKRIKEHRKATAELLGKPFEDDEIGDSASEMATTISERTGYSVATDTSTTLSVQDALNIPGISESLANTLKQKEILMERIKQYKEISKRPVAKSSTTKKHIAEKVDISKKASSGDLTQLSQTIKDKENALSVMQVKMKAMETTILDLQEKINEKDQIIEAKNKASALISDSLSKKEKDSVILLEDTKQQMIKMQENFVAMESEWKEEKSRLIQELEIQQEKVKNLEEANTILENARFELSLNNSKLEEEMDKKNKEILELQGKIEKFIYDQECSQSREFKEKCDEEEKGSLEIANMEELTKKIELLEQLNCQIRQANKELENKLDKMTLESKSTSSPSKKASPLPTRKVGRNTASKMKSPWSKMSTESLQETETKHNKTESSKVEIVVQSLNKDILEKEYIISQKDALICQLQAKVSQNEATMQEIQQSIIVKDSVTVDMVDAAVCTEPLVMSELIQPVIDDENNQRRTSEDKIVDESDLENKLKDALDRIAALNIDLETANKNMIKVKSGHKLKLKQMQKTIDNFSKVSDAHGEIIKLNEELHQLSLKVAELEEEKGNLQLHLVDYDSGRLTETDIYKKLLEMENLAETRLKAISVLESQKFDLVQDLHVLQQKYVEVEDKLADISQIQNEQVCTEMKSVQLEEQIDALTAAKRESELVIENLKLDKDQLMVTIKTLQTEKEELHNKLQQYIQENIELTDKLEKLSAEKVSSAESIEIVESLTLQEKLELEEYHKDMTRNDTDECNKDQKVSVSLESNVDVEKNVEESITELKSKIQLFTQERQEVMEKMSYINTENQLLNVKITDLSNHSITLQNNIEILNKEKSDLLSLNDDLNRQIEILKNERMQIMKESLEIVKPVNIEESIETNPELQLEDKSVSDKSNNRTKSVKQLTKEILKLKNIIKERENEIADCQMKILSLEEQKQKQNELIQNNASYETKVKLLTDENSMLKQELSLLKTEKDTELEVSNIKKENELLQNQMEIIKSELLNTIQIRDVRVQELENILLEYEKQIANLGNTLQQKDKEMIDYINQITKLNDVSQKLKSTIELLEEEKAKDQNAELIKTLNKQINVYQKKLNECEEKNIFLEEEKKQLLSLKNALENRNMSLDGELKKLQDSLSENHIIVKELQAQQLTHVDEVSALMCQAKERDEEIHEIKLQLRKESIENEKLRTTLCEKDVTIDELKKKNEELNEALIKLTPEKQILLDQYSSLEVKNKELMEKLKKFAISMKKKSLMYTDLEKQFHEAQNQLDISNAQTEQLNVQVGTLSILQEQLKLEKEEINRLYCEKSCSEQNKIEEINKLNSEIASLKNSLKIVTEDHLELNNSFSASNKELHFYQDQNAKLNMQIETLHKKLAEYEIEQKNSMNLITKVSSLESDISQKETLITELINKLETLDQKLIQLQFGHDAKLQERDLYTESLETEIANYKGRICRLEESISVMEDRRHSLERKADHLDSQLQEKEKAYSEYTSQEDELVTRLAVLMDHDRVVEKQLHEIEGENKELQNKIQTVNEENHRLRETLSDLQNRCKMLADKACKLESIESELIKCQTQCLDLDTNLKRVSNEYQVLLTEKKRDMDELESEFNTQIENAIKEKKILNEKYEKVNEYVIELENKLQEYSDSIRDLKINNEELTKRNQELLDKYTDEQKEILPDYTEQYIDEINKLNAVISGKNHEICDLNDQVKSLESKNTTAVCSLENTIVEIKRSLQTCSIELERSIQENTGLKESNAHIQKLLSQREDEIKQLIEKKKVTIEMNIPKTEGMIISSTIEAVTEEPEQFDVTSIESQILPVEPSLYPKNNQMLQKNLDLKKSLPLSKENVAVEEVVVPKKAYLCYDSGENITAESDPFNSEEGWGLGESEEVDNTQNCDELNKHINQLQIDNQMLKTQLEGNNAKLVKALKKLKELKACNDMLSNELKILKQVSQVSFLDTAIEDELRNNIQDLEKKVADLGSEVNKERREKELLKKQNEILGNASDRLTEMKEKLENEIELWKYKFKELNDKASNFSWTSSAQMTSDNNHQSTTLRDQDSYLQSQINKLENENDELQLIVDQLTSKNNTLQSDYAQLYSQIDNLNKQLLASKECEMCNKLNDQVSNLEIINTDLTNKNDVLSKKIHDVETSYQDLIQTYEAMKITNGELLKISEDNKDLMAKTNEMKREIDTLLINKHEAQERITSLVFELEAVTSKLQEYEEYKTINKSHPVIADETLLDKYKCLEDNLIEVKHSFDEANTKILSLNVENHDLLQKLESSSEKINDLEAKVQNLNKENDHLLSTVAELRSSVSSAVDQRGFEIAELWKQHLAQRESDFQKEEQELRDQLSAAEVKYEQLLNTVQSSTQEETNKLVKIEQVNSLQNKLQEKQEHLCTLQDKYAELMNQLDILRSESEDEKFIFENRVLGLQEDFEKQIQELSLKNLKQSENYNDNFKEINNELASAKTLNHELHQQVIQQTEKLNEQAASIVELNNAIQFRDDEIYKKTKEFTTLITQRNEEFDEVRNQLIEYEKKIEELTYEKETELAILRLKLHEQDNQYENLRKEKEVEKNNLIDELNNKIIECTSLSKQITELRQELNERITRTSEMQTILENQELEIVTLKDEIAGLQNDIRISNSKMEKRVTFSSDTKLGSDGGHSEEVLNTELLDAVPRAELDLALYMLHQRDVRCEELTMELTQLLEERDTLQLRLSDSLRSYEELKSKFTSVGMDTATSDPDTLKVLPSFSLEKEQGLVDIHRSQTSRSSSISETDGDRPKLQAKLSELRSVKHIRDVRLRQESEQRQMDLRLMQRDVANLPAEAVDQLAQAHHTLSRDSQSTSTVLLNWFRGKSTPKVVHM